MSWQPTSNIQVLRTRSDLLWTIREFFHKQGMYEVQTPVLSRDTVVDRHIDPIVLPGANIGLSQCQDQEYFLQTSPEFAMKRVLSAGMEGIYQIGPAFRSGERGNLHNPEFTMVEWYRAGDDLQAGIALLSALTQAVTTAKTIQLHSYQSVFLQHTGCDPLVDSVDDFSSIGHARLGVATDWSSDRDDWLNLLFSELVQPELGHRGPEVITHYPVSQSALARVCEDDTRTAERFELFIQGMELANGYNELTDPDELFDRNQSVNRQRQTDGKAPLPADSRLLEAMRIGLPPCSGCALGLDRLMMVLIGEKTIERVISFPIETA